MCPTSTTRIVADFHQRRDADGAVGAIDNRVSVRIIQRGALIHPGRKFYGAGEWSVLRHISPDRVVAFDRVPQRGGVLGGKLFDAAVAAFQRQRSGEQRGSVVDRHADWLPRLRMDVIAHGFGRRARSSWKKVLSSAFDI